MFSRPPAHPRALFVAIAMISTVASGAEGPTDTAVLQAKTWDQAIVLGPGAFRNGKITTKKNAKHSIQPGTLVEKANFGADGAAHWEIEGALLREVRFSGDLGTHLVAKDTAFEECHFAKSGGWFVGWAGTKWRFDNCVFTRSFMPANIGVHDYSVGAVGCTFVGIKMPVFGLKDKNPAKGVQGKDLQFVRCRFVGCEIPETTLAMTVDCVFESCQFSPKKHDWEEAEGPITVTGYVPVTKPPASYVNGKLTVNFVSGQPPQPAGAKLQHTLAGPRIILTWAQKLQAFTEFGSADKAASEIPVFSKTDAKASPVAPIASPRVPVPSPSGAPAAVPPPEPAPRSVIGKNSFFNLPETTPPAPRPVAPQPPVPPAPAPSVAAAAAPSANPAAKELRSLDELLAVVPMQQEFLTEGRVNRAALDAVNLKIDQVTAGKPIALRVGLDELLAHRADGYAFKVRGLPQPLTLRGQALTGRVEALCSSDQSEALSRIRKGATVLLRGVVSKAELAGSGRTVTLTVTMADAKVQ